jgi:hypothetical protein
MSARSHVRRAIRREKQREEQAATEQARQTHDALVADIIAAARNTGRIRVTTRGARA